MKGLRLLCFVFFSLVLWPMAYAQQPNRQEKNPGRKLFSFGVIADVQYADIEKAGKRDYGNSPGKLEKCVEEFNRHDLAFMISLGDLIDRDYSGFDKLLPILSESNAHVYHVMGNHDFSVEEKFKPRVRKRLDNRRGYFKFKIGRYTFLVVDGADLSLFAAKKDSREYKRASDKFDELKKAGANNAYQWNGGVGKNQLKWLERELRKADQSNQKVILFCHWPLLTENGTQLWNNREVVNMLKNHGSVVAWISGHHHAGGYAKEDGIHFLTLKGMVESQGEGSYGIMNVYDNRMVLKGYGDQQGRIMEFSD